MKEEKLFHTPIEKTEIENFWPPKIKSQSIKLSCIHWFAMTEATIRFQFENQILSFKIIDKENEDSIDRMVEIEGKGESDEGYLIAALFIELIERKKVKYCEKRKKQHFHRVEYAVYEYGILKNLANIARECRLSGPLGEPLTFIPTRAKTEKKKIESFSSSKTNHRDVENDEGFVMQPKGRNH